MGNKGGNKGHKQVKLYVIRHNATLRSATPHVMYHSYHSYKYNNLDIHSRHVNDPWHYTHILYHKYH